MTSPGRRFAPLAAVLSATTVTTGPVVLASRWKRARSSSFKSTTSNPASLISTLLEESYHAARDRVIAQFERQYLTWLVNRASGNMSKAARIAGVDRTTLYRLMERHGLQRSPTAGWVVEREPGHPGPETEDASVEATAGTSEGQVA